MSSPRPSDAAADAGPQVYLATTTLDEVLRQYGRAPAREHVSLTATQNTAWFLWGVQRDWIGFGALLTLNPRRVRVKGLWVRPEDRGRGWGTQGVRLLCDYAEQRGFTEVEQYAIRPQFWLDRGWAPLAPPRPNGAQRLLASLPLPRPL